MKKKRKEKIPPCPNCGSTKYDVDPDGQNGYCIGSCGAWFTIKEGKTKVVGHTESVTVPPGVPV